MNTYSIITGLNVKPISRAAASEAKSHKSKSDKTELQKIANNSPQVKQLKAYHELCNHGSALQVLSTPFQLFRNNEVVQKNASEEEFLKKGMQKVRPFRALFSLFLDETTIKALAVMIGLADGDISIHSFTSPLKKIIPYFNKKENKEELFGQLSHEFQKSCDSVLGNPDIRNEKRANFIRGKIGEFEGLIGELKASEQLINKKAEVTSIGALYTYGNKKKQEVDITAFIDGKKYYIEVAASTDKLKDKIDKGSQENSQMAGYKGLKNDAAQREEEVQIAYSCPVLTIDRVSTELIAKIKEKDISLILNGHAYTSAQLEELKKEKKEKTTTAGRAKNMRFLKYREKEITKRKQQNQQYRDTRTNDQTDRTRHTSHSLMKDYHSGEFDDYDPHYDNDGYDYEEDNIGDQEQYNDDYDNENADGNEDEELEE